MPYSYVLDSCQEYKIRHHIEVTWEKGPIRALALVFGHLSEHRVDRQRIRQLGHGAGPSKSFEFRLSSLLSTIFSPLAAGG